MSRLFGPSVSGAFSLLIGVGILSSLSAYLLTGARVTLSAARDGLFPTFAGRIHPTSRTPVLGILLHAGVSIGLIWVNDARALLDGAAAGLGFMGLFVVSAVYLLRRRPDYRPEFRCPGYPLTPLVYVVLTVASLTLSLFNPAYRLTTLIASGAVLSAIPLFFVVRAMGLVRPRRVNVG
jgi:APA family basic amino acid/polyamine antiporter